MTGYWRIVATPVEIDESKLGEWAGGTLAGPFSSNDGKVRHDSERLAEAVLSAIELSRGTGAGAAKYSSDAFIQAD